MDIAVEKSVRFSEKHLKRLESKGKVIFFEKNEKPQNWLKAVKGCDIIIVNKTFYNQHIPKLKCKMISVWATGYDPVDVQKCRENDITVCNVPGYSTDSVAEHVFAMIMQITKKICKQNKATREGKWNHDLDPFTELKGKALGIIGFGNIGKRVAEIGTALKMEILVHSRKAGDYPYQFVVLEDLLRNSDFVTVHLALNEETKGFIGKTEFGMMRVSSYFINCSRGPIVDTKALVDEIKSNGIRGAALDVYDKEPLPKTSELFKLDNVILTPHTAFVTEEALERLGNICIDNIDSFLEEQPINVVN